MRFLEMSAKTVEEAVQAACEALGVDRDDINVSYEVLEFPARKLFRTIPAKVRVTVAEPEKVEAPAPVQEEAAAAPAPVQEPVPAAAPAPVQSAPAAGPAAEPVSGEEEVPLDIAADPRLQAAVEYLTPIFRLMGVEEFSFTALKKGEATILRVSGQHMGVLIGRRGETMESLSYLASLVVNRMEGPYIKLGIDVGGYRGKREDDLAALARRLAEKVVRTGYCHEMEPMNPYERHIIHTAIAEVEGVRSESKGEGPARHVVIYSTDPNASNLPDRESRRPRRDGGRGRQGGDRAGRGGSRGGSRGPRRDGGNRGPRRDRGDRGGYGRGKGGSSVPAREFADLPRDPDAKPMVPSRSERIHDGDDFAFGKIEL